MGTLCAIAERFATNPSIARRTAKALANILTGEQQLIKQGQECELSLGVGLCLYLAPSHQVVSTPARSCRGNDGLPQQRLGQLCSHHWCAHGA